MNCFQGSIFPHSSTANTFIKKFHTHKCIHATATLSAPQNLYRQDWPGEGTVWAQREGGGGMLTDSIRLSALGVGVCARASMLSCFERLFPSVWQCHSACKDWKKVSVDEDCFIYQASRLEVHVLFRTVSSLLSNIMHPLLCLIATQPQQLWGELHFLKASDVKQSWKVN